MEPPIICRSCLVEITDEYIPMETQWNNTTVLDVFNYCTKLKASLDDEFPTSLCIACGTTLQTVYDFIKTSYETDQILHSSIGGYSIENEDYPVDSSLVKKIESKLDGVQFQEEYIEENHIDFVEVKEENDKYFIEDLSQNEQLENDFVDENKESFEIKILAESELSAENIDSNEIEVTNETRNNFHNNNAESVEKQGRIKRIQRKPPNKELRLYRCDTCEKLFKNMLSRNKHEFLDHPVSPERKCKLCNFSTSSLKSWQTHRYRHEHPTQKKYLCSFCPKKFPNPKSLLMHEDYQHGNKDIAAKCDKCDKKFMNKQKLEYHILSRHSNGRNFQCPQCPKTFKNDFQLRAHKKLHSERTISCPECDKKFARQVDLKVHMRLHTGELPYQCELCDKRYRIKVRLTYHMQKHLGKKHVCEFCSSEFNSKPKLRLHMFEHIGMPYVCDECQAGFNNRLGLSRHSKSVHNIIMSDEELLRNRLKNEVNIKRGLVCETDLIDRPKEEMEV